MKEHHYGFSYLVFDSADELNDSDRQLLMEARRAAESAYAPYSKFYVGAAARTTDGRISTGSNQENASFPVGICAERVLLGNIASNSPTLSIESMAISYRSDSLPSDHPISPCGMCRQALQEFEGRTNAPIRLIMGGMGGKIYVVESASLLLPLAFTNEELK